MNQQPLTSDNSGFLAAQSARIAGQQQAERQKERLFQPLDQIGTEMMMKSGKGVGKFLSSKTGVKSFEALGENVQKNGLAGGLRKTATDAFSEAVDKAGAQGGEAVQSLLAKHQANILSQAQEIQTSVTSKVGDAQTALTDGLNDAKNKASGALDSATSAATDAVDDASAKASGALDNASSALSSATDNASSALSSATDDATSAVSNFGSVSQRQGNVNSFLNNMFPNNPAPGGAGDFQSIQGQATKAQGKAQALYDAGKSNITPATPSADGKNLGTDAQDALQTRLDALKSRENEITPPKSGVSDATGVGPATQADTQVQQRLDALRGGGDDAVADAGADASAKASADDAVLSNLKSRFGEAPPVGKGLATNPGLGAPEDAEGYQDWLQGGKPKPAIPASPAAKDTSGLVEDKSPQDDFSQRPDTSAPSQKVQPDTKLDEGGTPDDLVAKAPAPAPAGGATPAQPAPAQPAPATGTDTQATPGGTSATQLQDEDEDSKATGAPTQEEEGGGDEEGGGEEPAPSGGSDDEDKDDDEDPASGGGGDPDPSLADTLGTDAVDSTVADESPVGDVVTGVLGVASLVAGLFGGGSDHQEQPAMPSLAQSYSAGATTNA